MFRNVDKKPDFILFVKRFFYKIFEHFLVLTQKIVAPLKTSIDRKTVQGSNQGLLHARSFEPPPTPLMLSKTGKNGALLHIIVLPHVLGILGGNVIDSLWKFFFFKGPWNQLLCRWRKSWILELTSCLFYITLDTAVSWHCDFLTFPSTWIYVLFFFNFLLKRTGLFSGMLSDNICWVFLVPLTAGGKENKSWKINLDCRYGSPTADSRPPLNGASDLGNALYLVKEFLFETG